MLIYNVCDFFYDSYNIIVYNSKITLKFLFLLFLVYILRCGSKHKFEAIFKRVFCCLNVFIYYLFPKLFNFDIYFYLCVEHSYYYKLIDFLNIVWSTLLVDFKLIIFDINKRRIRKKCFSPVIFEDLLREHTDFYVQAKTVQSFLMELRLNLKQRRGYSRSHSLGFFRLKRLEEKRALLDPVTKKPVYAVLQPISLYPVCVTFEYKRLKVFSFLFKSAKLQDHKCLYVRLSREILMSFFNSSLSFYIVGEIIQITISHQYDIKF